MSAACPTCLHSHGGPGMTCTAALARRCEGEVAWWRLRSRRMALCAACAAYGVRLGLDLRPADEPPRPDPAPAGYGLLGIVAAGLAGAVGWGIVGALGAASAIVLVAALIVARRRRR